MLLQPVVSGGTVVGHIINFDLAGAVSANEVMATVSWEDIDRNGKKVGAGRSYTTESAGTDDVLLLNAPSHADGMPSGASLDPDEVGARSVQMMAFHNADTAAVTLRVWIDDGTDERTVYKATLQTLETAVYTPSHGWQTLTTAGAVKNVAAVTGASLTQGAMWQGGSSALAEELAIGDEGSMLGPNLAGTDLQWGPPGRGYTKIIGSACAPVTSLDGTTGALATGADTTVTNVSLGNGYPNMAIYNTGTNDTLENPRVIVDANCCDGLELPITQTDNIGIQCTWGASMPNLLAGSVQDLGPACFKVGTTPDFYVEFRIGIPDISDYDIFFAGLVEPAAYVQTAALTTPAHLLAAYDEKAGFAIVDNAGDIAIQTSLANADVETDLTSTDWVNDAVKTLRILVSAAGVVTYRLWDNVTEDTSLGEVAFTFANATILTPIIIAVRSAGAASAENPILQFVRWGYQG